MKKVVNDLLIPVDEIKYIKFSINPRSFRIVVKGKNKFSWEEYFDRNDFIKAKKRYDFLREIVNKNK